MNFNVTKETQGSSIMPIPAPHALAAGTVDPMFPNGYSFPIAQLVNVTFEPEKEVNRDNVITKEPVLSFVFVDKEKRRATKSFFVIPSDDPDMTKKHDENVQMIKHFWDETVGEENFPEKGLAPGAKDFASFYKGVADSFNAATYESPAGGETPKLNKLYAKDAIYIKQTLYKNRSQFPKFPNVIQRAVRGGKQIPCIKLDINPTYDTIVKKAESSTSSGNSSFVPDTSINDTFPDIN